MDDDDNLFDNDMIEQSVVYSDPMKGVKHKIPWSEKHRPKKLQDIIYQHEVVKVLSECLKTGKLTHMLFYGPPGTGKTSSILSFCNELYGPNIINQRVIELNASDERGINVVRNKIITFAKTAVGNPDPDYPSPPFKIIILDEADAMTTEAQSALRTVMESMSNVTRFCFVCNYINQIIDPIASRCMKFRFRPINEVAMKQKLQTVSIAEKFPISDNVLDKLVELVKGDVRHGIMTLQYLKYIYDYQGNITIHDVYKTTNYLPIEEVQKLWKIIVLPTTTIKNIKSEIYNLKQKGYSIHAVIEQISTTLVNKKDLNDKQKSLICIKMSDIEKMLIDGADEYLQLFSLLATIHGVYRRV